MNIIRERVKVNGSKTDGFTGLLLKAYLIIDTETRKEYSPFYLWNETQGMNKFIFEGFYDNILTSFGWQQINIAVPICFEFSDEIATANYMLEIEQIIEPTSKLSTLSIHCSFAFYLT
ncbi:DUF4865 family protein [Listeria seeligeri]|uniref:DUF4865 family protein n=1 Tax=Listeria seeligeri TaxID=1640 RepID=UPI0016292151|nr:DUF4865 family protein [Listeria seeligeri]